VRGRLISDLAILAPPKKIRRFRLPECGMKRMLRNRRVLVTGASRGIGRAIAVEAVGRGARVAVVARSAEALDELTRFLADRGEVLAISADVTSQVDRERIVQTVLDHFGGLDVLINNAGVGSHGPFAQSTEEALRQVMEVNFYAPAELMRRFIPILEQGTQPAIVNIGSMCGRRGVPAWSEYSASKFALTGLTEALRAEMVRFDIDVLLVQPGLTRTDFPRHLVRHDQRLLVNFDRGMPPERLAIRVLDAVEANRPETVVGREARWLLRLERFFPRLVDRLFTYLFRRVYPPQP
jgi:short-subunit dehydrogenase